MPSVRIFRMNPKRDDERVSIRKYTKEDIKNSISILKEFCGRNECSSDHELANEKENAEVLNTICNPEFLKSQTESIDIINRNLVKCGLVHVR